MTDQELANLRSDRSALEQAIRVIGGRRRGALFRMQGSACTCPFCEDRHASAGIYEDGGAWKFKCHGKCQFQGDLIDVLAQDEGKTVAEIIREKFPSNLGGGFSKPAANAPRVYKTIDELISSVQGCEDHYIYTNPDTGKPDLVVIRVRNRDGSKRFLQCSPTPGGFWMKKPEGLLPIFNRTRVRESERVLVVEGEKCVKAAQEIGIVATTTPGGALKGQYADLSPLAGKALYFWSDNDEPDDEYPRGKGVAHMEDLLARCRQLTPAPRCFWIDHTALWLEPKGDIADYLAGLGEMEPGEKQGIVLDLMEEAKPLSDAGEFRSFIDEVADGKMRAYDWPWHSLGNLTRALRPGTATVLCGEAGSTKSMLLIEALAHWTDAGIKACVFELEDEKRLHIHRAVAQRAGLSEFTDLEWIRLNADAARSITAKHEEFINTLSRLVWDAPDEQRTLDELAEWAEARAKEGFEIIAIDPVTAAAGEAKPWVADAKFILQVKTIARKYRTRIILVTHPKTGFQDGKGLSGIAGGQAYPRFCHCVLWVKALEKSKFVTVEKLDGPVTAEINRVIQIRKARNGKGAGLSIGYTFYGETLRLMEQGVIVEGDEE